MTSSRVRSPGEDRFTYQIFPHIGWFLKPQVQNVLQKNVVFLLFELVVCVFTKKLWLKQAEHFKCIMEDSSDVDNILKLISYFMHGLKFYNVRTMWNRNTQRDTEECRLRNRSWIPLWHCNLVLSEISNKFTVSLIMFCWRLPAVMKVISNTYKIQLTTEKSV